MINAIITAAGTSNRMCGIDKLYLPAYNYSNITVIENCVRAFIPFVDSITVVTAYPIASHLQSIIDTIKTTFKNINIVQGGLTRAISVSNGINSLPKDSDIVLIHDGARPYVSGDLISRVIADTKLYGNSIPAIISTNSLYSSTINSYINRDNIYNIMTPQGFNTKQLIKAYTILDSTCHESTISSDKSSTIQAKISSNIEIANFTDEGSIYLAKYNNIHMTKGEESNIKITTIADLQPITLIGNGYDTHQLVVNRKLILGGIDIPHTKGLLGHSDADVITHALMDSILNASGLRDIGYYFPDTDNQYKGISSTILLQEVMKLIERENLVIGNVSISILAEQPKLSVFIPSIKENLSKYLNVSIDKIGISATTTEKLGFVGREEGIACYSSVILSSK